MKHPVILSEEDRNWEKYCGFLDLSVKQFMSIQEALLLQQLKCSSQCQLTKKLLGNKIPATVNEFRRSVPLTRYDDYIEELERLDGSALAEKPYVWVQTTGGSNTTKRVPYTYHGYQVALDNLMSVFLLACSRQRGQSDLLDGDKVLFNVAPAPYLSGILASGVSEKFNLKPILSPELHDSMDFKEKVSKGFEKSLSSGVDIIIAMTSVLMQTGERFDKLLNSRTQKNKNMRSPRTALRFVKAALRSRLENRTILPKDLWSVKALIGWGIDTSIYREQVHKYWGTYPFEFHACTEAGVIAVQNWNKKGMTMIPYSNFYEFIPESEWLRSKDDALYEPRTVLLPELEPGKQYELVITNYYRMPFIRYRLGHLIRVTSVADEEAEVYLPQIAFESRADDLIDIAGFTRVSEKIVAQAIANIGVKFKDWTIRKEVKDSKPTLHLYIELTGIDKSPSLAPALHRELTELDPHYNDLDKMMNIQPLQVTELRPGTFDNYYMKKRQQGAELVHLRPSRMNASDDVIDDLVSCEREEAVLVA